MAAARIPAERYLSRAVLEREHAALWPRAWLMAAHLDELDGELPLEIGAERLLVWRDGGAPRARAARGEAIECASFAGFAWVRLQGGVGPSLAGYLGELEALIGAYDLGSWGVESAVSTELACNWKASVDAHNEGYHVQALHPEVLPLVDDCASRVEHFGDHSRIAVPMGRASARLKDARLSALVRASLAAEGIDAAPFAADPEGARRALQAARRARVGSGLSDDQLSDSHQFFVFPNVHVNASAEEAMVMRHRPHRRDPERTRFDLYVLRRGRRRGPVRCRQVAPDDAAFGPVTGADLALLPALQRGMRSRGFTGLHLSAQEACIARMHEALERWLA